MDTEKQKSSPGGTVPGEKVPPVLMAEDVAALRNCAETSPATFTKCWTT